MSPSDFNATDGNLLLDNSALPPPRNTPLTDPMNGDWESFAGSIICSLSQGCGLDAPSGKTDDSYTRGAKEDSINPAVSVGSIPPSKDNLLRWYFAQEFLSGEAFLYLAWVRDNQLATATIDFELNQLDELELNLVNAVRSEGDVLITYDFKGGRVEGLGLLRWLTDNGTNTNADCEANNGRVDPGCWGNKVDLLASGFAEGSVNFDNNGTNKPGDDGYPVEDPIESVTIEKARFGEAAINLTAGIGSGEDECLIFTRACRPPSVVKIFILPLLKLPPKS